MIPRRNEEFICPYIPPVTTPPATLDTFKATGSISPTHINSVLLLASQHSEAPSPVVASRIIPVDIPPTQAQIDIVRYSWERLSEIRHLDDDPNVSAPHAFGLAFYEALFELDPSLKLLFNNIFQQARALAGMVAYIARAPSVSEPDCYRSSPRDSSSLPPTCKHSAAYHNSDITPPAEPLTIREINAMKRKDSTAANFSELVTSISANTTVTDIEEGELERLLYKLRELGARHYFYKVKPHQIDLVGSALLTAIKKRLGKEFLPEIAEAWTRAHAYAAYHIRAGIEAQIAWEQDRRKSAVSKLSLSSSSNSTHNPKSNCLIQ